MNTRPPKHLTHALRTHQTIPRDFADRGYGNQLCVDFSQVVVDLMSKRHECIKGIEWRYLDVAKMDSVPDKSIDFAFDKSTMDAMVHGSPWSPPKDVTTMVGSYMQEVSLRPGSSWFTRLRALEL